MVSVCLRIYSHVAKIPNTAPWRHSAVCPNAFESFHRAALTAPTRTPTQLTRARAHTHWLHAHGPHQIRPTRANGWGLVIGEREEGEKWLTWAAVSETSSLTREPSDLWPLIGQRWHQEDLLLTSSSRWPSTDAMLMSAWHATRSGAATCHCVDFPFSKNYLLISKICFFFENSE
jgi:hypothetical protein